MANLIRLDPALQIGGGLHEHPACGDDRCIARAESFESPIDDRVHGLGNDQVLLVSAAGDASVALCFLDRAMELVSVIPVAHGSERSR
jgi:hypothetical protein